MFQLLKNIESIRTILNCGKYKKKSIQTLKFPCSIKILTSNNTLICFKNNYKNIIQNLNWISYVVSISILRYE